MQINNYLSNQKENFQYNSVNQGKAYLSKPKKDDDLLSLKKDPLLKTNYVGLNFANLNSYNSMKGDDTQIKSHRSGLSEKYTTNPAKTSMYLAEKSLTKLSTNPNMSDMSRQHMAPIFSETNPQPASTTTQDRKVLGEISLSANHS